MSLATLNIVLIHYLEKWLEPNYLVEKLVLVSTITENNPIKDIMKRESPVQSDFDPDSSIFYKCPTAQQQAGTLPVDMSTDSCSFW